MSPYKSFISAAKTYLESNVFLKFLLSARIVVLALGGLFYLLGIFLINIRGVGAVSIYDAFTCLGVVLMLPGLLLNIIAEDSMTVLIVSGSASVASLIAWIVLLARSYPFLFTPLFYFLAFGAICLLIFLKSEYFVKLRAEAAARNEQMRTNAAAEAMSCARCGTSMPKTAGFCPNCGAPNPATQYAPPVPPYAPPAGPQSYAPPAGPYAPTTYQPYTPPAAPPYAPPAASPYAPPMPPPFVPAEQAVTAPPAAPAEPEEIVPPAAPAEPEEIVPPAAAVEPEEPAQTPYIPAEPALPAVKQCINCGAQLPAGAVFCGKCGTKQ